MSFNHRANKQITNISAEQVRDTIEISWNKYPCSRYIVEVDIDGKMERISSITKEAFTIRNVTCPAKYQIRVSGENKDGSEVPGATLDVDTKKVQNIEVSVESVKGHRGDEMKIEASANGDLTFASSDEEVISIDKEGHVQLLENGEETITVTAKETDEYIGDEVVIPAICYPEALGKPELKIRNIGDASVEYSFKPIPYAEKYVLQHYIKGKHKYVKFREFNASDYSDVKTISIEGARMSGKYRLLASAVVSKEETLKSRSDNVKVKTGLEKAKVYSSIRETKHLTFDDVDLVGDAGEPSGFSTQGICCTDEGYVVVAVSKGGSARLEKVSFDGKHLKESENYSLGHGNGCTYNPNTGNVYVLKTARGGGGKTLAVFDAKTLKHKKNITLFTSPSGIAYDEVTDRYYLSGGNHYNIANSDFGNLGRYYRKRHHHPQDIGGYNGIVLSCIWLSGSESYIDLYRQSDGAYLGTIGTRFGEVESACVDDGHLVVLMSHGNIYRTKKRLAFF